MLVCEAEKNFGSGEGKAKFAEVFAAFSAKLPAFLRGIFTEKYISEMIESAVLKMKNALKQ